MTFPPTVPFVTLTAGSAFALENADELSLNVAINAVRPNGSRFDGLVWAATGERFPAIGDTVTAPPGQPVQVDLPATNAEGWKTAQGAPIDVDGGNLHTHAYVVSIEFRRNGSRVGKPVRYGPLFLPEGESPVDLDTLVVVPQESGVPIALPDLWTGLVEQALAAVQESGASTITSGEVVGDDLILTAPNGDTVNAGNVRGPKGDKGDKGDVGPAPTPEELAPLIEDGVVDVWTPTVNSDGTVSIPSSLYVNNSDGTVTFKSPADMVDVPTVGEGGELPPAVEDRVREIAGDTTRAAKQTGSRLMGTWEGTHRDPIPGLTVGALTPTATRPNLAETMGSATLTTAGPHYITTPAPHGLKVGDAIAFSPLTGATGLSASRAYYVHATPTDTTFQIRASIGDTARQQFTSDGTATLYKWPILELPFFRDAGTLNPAFRFLNGRPAQAGSSHPRRDWVQADPTTVTYSPGIIAGTGIASEFTTSDTGVGLILVNSVGSASYVYVDDRLLTVVSEADFGTAGIGIGSTARLPLTFTTAKPRTIRVETTYVTAVVAGVERRQTHPITPPSTPRGPRLLISGDSFTEGGSAGQADSAAPWVMWTQRLLGLRDVWRAGSGGSGWARPGDRPPLIDRWENDIVAQAPDTVVIALGHNDVIVSTATVKAAAETVVDGIIDALPATEIILVGPFSAKGWDYSAQVFKDHDDALRDVAQSRGLQFISPMKEEWITGNGNVGSPTGIGNADVYISSDGTHPTPAGHKYLGWRMAGHLARPTLSTGA